MRLTALGDTRRAALRTLRMSGAAVCGLRAVNIATVNAPRGLHCLGGGGVVQDAGIEPNLILRHCCDTHGSERLLVSLFGPPAAGDFLLISCVFIKSRSHRGTTTTQHSMTHKHTAWSRRLRVKPVHADLAAIHSTYFTCWPRRLLAAKHSTCLTFDLAAIHSTPRPTF